MGSSAWIQGWRPRKVDYMDNSMASDVAMVVVSHFGHVDDMEWTVRDPGVDGASILAAPRSWFGSLTRGQRAAEFSRAVQGYFRAKAQCISANGNNACGYRNPLGGAVVVILLVLRLRVKTLHLAVSTAVALCVVTLLWASSWSPRFHLVSFQCLRRSGFSVFFFCLSLIYM
jgi:hypothetical protein